MQHVAEALEDGMDPTGGDLTQLLPAFLEEGDGHLDRVVGRRLQQQGEDLQGQDLVRHLLVDQVGDEAGAGHAAGLVVPLEAPLEVEDETLEQELPDVRELGVDNRDEGGVHVGEGGGRGLSLEDAKKK